MATNFMSSKNAASPPRPGSSMATATRQSAKIVWEDLDHREFRLLLLMLPGKVIVVTVTATYRLIRQQTF
jgi:hypothetical protein